MPDTERRHLVSLTYRGRRILFLLFVLVFVWIGLCLGVSPAGAKPPLDERCHTYAEEVVLYNPGLSGSGGPIDDDRDNPENALGKPEDNDTLNFVTLGFHGEIVLRIGALPPDVEITGLEIVETSYGNPSCERYPEKATVYISDDATNWVHLGTICQDHRFDMEGFTSVQYVRLVDASNPDDFGGAGDGFDLDGIMVSCKPIPTLTPTASPEPTPTLELTATSTPTATASPEPTFSPQPTVTLTPTVTMSPEPTTTLTPSSTASLEPSPSPEVTASLPPSPTAPPVSTATPTPTPVAPPVPPSTPTPTRTALPEISPSPEVVVPLTSTPATPSVLTATLATIPAASPELSPPPEGVVPLTPTSIASPSPTVTLTPTPTVLSETAVAPEPTPTPSWRDKVEGLVDETSRRVADLLYALRQAVSEYRWLFPFLVVGFFMIALALHLILARYGEVDGPEVPSDEERQQEIQNSIERCRKDCDRYMAEIRDLIEIRDTHGLTPEEEQKRKILQTKCQELVDEIKVLGEELAEIKKCLGEPSNLEDGQNSRPDRQDSI